MSVDTNEEQWLRGRLERALGGRLLEEVLPAPRTLEGLELEWPPAVPREGERPESLILIASDMAVDLRMLETSGHRGVEAEPSPMKYAVKRIGFWLDPRPALR